MFPYIHGRNRGQNDRCGLPVHQRAFLDVSILRPTKRQEDSPRVREWHPRFHQFFQMKVHSCTSFPSRCLFLVRPALVIPVFFLTMRILASFSLIFLEVTNTCYSNNSGVDYANP